MSTRRPVTDFDGWMRDQERRMRTQERRPQISPDHLLGPGLAGYAVQISDWNGDETAYNGFFFSTPGALNAPDSIRYWIGWSFSDGNGRGYQRVFDYVSTPGFSRWRTFSTADGAARAFSAWAGDPFMNRWRPTNLAIPDDGSAHNIPFGTQAQPDQNMADLGSGVYQAFIPGLYQINASVVWDNANTTNRRDLFLVVNGTNQVRSSIPGSLITAAGGLITHSISAAWKLADGDSFSIAARQNTGGSTNIITDSLGTVLQVCRTGD